MAYPYTDPTTRPRRVNPPPPPDMRPLTVTPGVQSDAQDATYNDDSQNWTGVQAGRQRLVGSYDPAMTYTDGDPRVPSDVAKLLRSGQEPAAPPSDAYNLEFSGVRPPAGGAASVPTAPADRAAPALALPPPPDIDINATDGLNSVGKKLAEYGPHTRFGPLHTTPDGRQIGNVAGQGTDAQLRALMAADPTAPVTRTPEGFEIGNPAPHGKKYGILHGLLQGALEGGKVGGWKGALGGAATGGIAGAVNPTLIQALERQEEIDRTQRTYDRQTANTAKQGQISLQRSQAEENTAQAERARTGTPHYIQQNDGSWVAAYDDRAVPVNNAVTGVPVVGKDPDAETESQRKNREETIRYHDAMTKQRDVESKKRDERQKEQDNRYQLHIDGATGDHILFNPKSGKEITAKRGSKAAVKVAQANALWTAAGQQYDTDAKPKFDAADKLREEADKLGQDEQGNDDYGAAIQNKGKIDAKRKQADKLEREAEGIAAKVRASQTEGDKLAAEAQATESAGKAGRAKPAGRGKRWSKAQWQSANPTGDAAAAEQAAKSRGYSVVP